MNIQPGKAKCVRKARPARQGSLGEKLSAVFRFAFVVGAVAGLLNIYIFLNQKITETERSIRRTQRELHQTERDSISLLIIPGAIIPFLAQFPPAVIHGGFTWQSILDAGADAVLAAVFSALLFPLAIMLLDLVGSSLSLELFADAKERLRNRQRRS